MALKRDKFVISWRRTRVIISLSTRVPDRIGGKQEVGRSATWFELSPQSEKFRTGAEW
jgi:hypothetical protein